MAKQRKTKAQRIAEAEQQLMETLNRVGYKRAKHHRRALKIQVTPAHKGDIPANGTVSKINKYTGDVIIGISQMHKSNAVPVTKKEQIVEHSKMRRS